MPPVGEELHEFKLPSGETVDVPFHEWLELVQIHIDGWAEQRGWRTVRVLALGCPPGCFACVCARNYELTTTFLSMCVLVFRIQIEQQHQHQHQQAPGAWS